MKIQKELVKDQQRTCEDVQTDPKLTSSLAPGKNRAPKTSLSRSAAQNKGKKSGTQTVLDMIKRSEKGIEAGTLIEKTGFEDKKIRNILFKALTDGKIERVVRGVYKSSKG